MFTGIVKGTGRILAVIERSGDKRLEIGTGDLDLGDIRVGDSISVNGVCLTAVDPEGDRFSADVSAETLGCTTIGRLSAGDAVNLEGSLRLGEPIAGHMVYGHVDAVGEVVDTGAGVAGGEGGIRTLDGLLTHTPLAGERLQPLGHLSGNLSVSNVQGR